MEAIKSKKLKILAAGDIHGSSDIAKKLAEKAKKENVDLVLLLGDIHGPFESRNIIAPFKKANQKVLFVPGNWDSSADADLLKDLYGIKNLDGYYVTYKDIGILGIGNPDFQLFLDEDKAFKKLKKNFEKMKMDKKILISHLHAAGTKSEFSGFPGSSALRKAIDEFKPDLFLSAHIHEAEGIEEKIGKTKIINVGRKGQIIEI
ncbi:MAG: metallophosphoesterase family protein [Nanoarchaeota archaeon]|nr:metallophosphoesterase family protein [Nanoarchaeota archaeon]